MHEFEEIPLYYYEEGIMHVFAGLEDDLTRALKHCKFKVKVKRVKPPILEPVLENLTEEDLDNLDDRADQVEVIGLVCDQPRSFIVEAPTGWGKSFAIVQIAKILPDSNIAIIAPGIESKSYANGGENSGEYDRPAPAAALEFVGEGAVDLPEHAVLKSLWHVGYLLIKVGYTLHLASARIKPCSAEL